MPDSARNQLTGRKITARDLKSTQLHLGAIWECTSCSVEMIPVACGEKQYRTPPHFRAKGEHETHCRFFVPRKNISRREHREVQERRAKPSLKPTELQFPMRPKQTVIGGPEPSKRSTSIYRGLGKSPSSKERQGWKVFTLQPVVEAYCESPEDENDRLKIQGCCCNTYASCFRQLTNTSGYFRFKPKVFFAPIRIAPVENRRHHIALKLNPVVWPTIEPEDGDWKPCARYCLSFRTRDWESKDSASFVNYLNELVQKQREAFRDTTELPILAFFLGAQDEHALNQFNIEHNELICFVDQRHYPKVKVEN